MEDKIFIFIAYAGFGFCLGFLACLKFFGDLANTITANTNRQVEIFDEWTDSVNKIATKMAVNSETVNKNTEHIVNKINSMNVSLLLLKKEMNK
ncbi:MAG: hypothetical protein ABFD50_08275 [Smithella sp.]